jgi:hypothetical protein
MANHGMIDPTITATASPAATLRFWDHDGGGATAEIGAGFGARLSVHVAPSQ